MLDLDSTVNEGKLDGINRSGQSKVQDQKLIRAMKAMDKIQAKVSIAAKLANFLPSSNAEFTLVSEGGICTCIDDSLPPVPTKLAAKIQKEK